MSKKKKKKKSQETKIRTKVQSSQPPGGSNLIASSGPLGEAAAGCPWEILPPGGVKPENNYLTAAGIIRPPAGSDSSPAVHLWLFEALDTLFFRDSTPFNAGEGGRGGLRSHFPPFMFTLQGAIRTALAYGQGWQPEEGSEDTWPAELGDENDLGCLKLRGPYLVVIEEAKNRTGGTPTAGTAGRVETSRVQVLFPFPLHVLRGRDEREQPVFTRLVPGAEVECDLGRVRLPRPLVPYAGLKVPENWWLTAAGMNKVLAGGLPAAGDIRKPEQLWFEEYRVGIARDRARRTAEDHKIYSVVHVRPTSGQPLSPAGRGNGRMAGTGEPGDENGWRRTVKIAVLVDGVPGEWHGKAVPVINLGGEGRLSVIEKYPGELILPALPDLPVTAEGNMRFTVTLITPGYFENLEEVVIKGPPGIPGRCVAACVGKVIQAGGWDLRKEQPRSLVPLLPAGSTWFYEAAAEEKERVQMLHGAVVGDKPAYGWGQILIGRWEEKQ